jgi:K+-transporting ATPase ATPase B chain
MKIFKKEFILPAAAEALKKLNPAKLWKKPVMFVVEAGSIITTMETIHQMADGLPFSFSLQVSILLWATVIFANFAEALAEIKGKARSESLRSARNTLSAFRFDESGREEKVSAGDLRKNDIVAVREGETIPGDGDIIEGSALVDESAMTGESAPVIRESGGDRCGVTGGTRLISGTVRIRITVNPGESFLDSMINMVESAKRKKSPNESAMDILLFSLTLLFIVIVVTIPSFAGYMGIHVNVTVLVALLVCLMPTTIGGLLPAIGIAGMDRLIQHNVLAMSGRAVEAAGDVNVVLLDKTGTITLGNRMASEFIPAEGVEKSRLTGEALLASLADETPEGRSIVVLAKNELGIHGGEIRAPEGALFVPFSPATAMSGINYGGVKVRKGSIRAIGEMLKALNVQIPGDIIEKTDEVSRAGDTPLVVARNEDVLGVIRLKDIVKSGIALRVAQLRKIGIKSVMITGDNNLTAASIAAEAGLDDFVANAKPETKLEMIKKYQDQGNLVAMIGDGTNDAPALAQADVAVAMNAGTQAAREAANMIDLDSSPAKLLDIVEIGKEILITRGALTTFSITNDVSKYFAIIPALFAVKYPLLGTLNIMNLGTPESAILSAIIFNTLIIPALIPVALRGVKYRAQTVSAMLRQNLLVYGLGGIALPFIAIKAIDMLINLRG